MTRTANQRARPTRFRQLLALPGALIAILLCLSVYSEWLGFDAARTYPPQGTFSVIGGEELHYREARPQGTPKGTVVLVHGAWADHADLFASLAPHLRDYRVIAIDRPGQGWSSRSSDMQMAVPARQADALMALLDRIAPERIVLVAHSLGGPLSTYIALQRPERLRALVLISAITHPWLGDVQYLSLPASPTIGPFFNRLLFIPIASILVPKAIGIAFSPQSAPPDYAAASELPLLYREKTFRANIQDLLATEAFLQVLAPHYGDLHVPTVVITGDSDALVSPVRHSAAIAREVPNAKLMVLPGVGHMPHHARPQLIAEVISALIDQER